jgi:hypothetical protein
MITTDDIIWGDPPPNQRQPGRTLRFVELLKTRPGEWGLYPMTASSPASATNNKKRFPGTEWKARKSLDEPGRFRLYGRWVGDDQ